MSDTIFKDADLLPRGGEGGPPADTSPFKIIVADDEQEVHSVTRMVLTGFHFNGRPVEMLSAFTGEECIQLVRDNPDAALVLLDVVMEAEDSGLVVVKRIREELDNHLVRIVLRTGQPGQAPEERVIRAYDINDYKAKTELTAQRLTTTVIAALRTWQHLQIVERQRRGLEHIVVSSVRLFEYHTVRQFVHEALLRLCHLLGLARPGEPPPLSAVAAARDDDAASFRVVAGTGDFALVEADDFARLVPAEVIAEIEAENGISRQIFGDDWMLCYHRAPGRYQMAIYVTGENFPAEVDPSLVRVYCLNTALSLETLRRNDDLQHEVEEHAATAGELRRHQDQLEELVRERTAELEQEIERRTELEGDLITARDLAEEANESKSRFLAKVSHEVRTPLHGVLGMMRLLQDDDLSVEQRSYVAHAQRSGELMLDIINDILDISKIEAGKIELEDAEFDLRDTVEDLCGLLAIRAAQRDIDLVVDYPATVPVAVRGDRVRLRQVITNLVANAVKFTEAGHVLVAVGATDVAPDRATFSIRVADTGIGISEEQQSRIFSEFVQADASTHRRFGGTGLGLVISRQLLTMMGGQLDLASRPGEGSTFTVTLGLPVTAPLIETRLLESQRGRRFLIVDPLDDGRRVIRQQLEAIGGTCEEAAGQASAQLAIRAADDMGFTAVVATQKLADGSGRHLAEQIAATEQAGPPVVLVQTAYDGTLSRELKRCGVEIIMPRALVSSSLGEVVGAMLAGERARDRRDPLTPFNLRTGGKRDTSTVLMGTGLGLRVLLAEDNVVSRKVATAMLTRFGCDYEVATDGGEVLERLAAEDFDALLLDCNLPVMDGFEVVRRIRQREADSERHLPVIALTANTMPGDREACLAAGMDDYIAKPFDPHELRVTLLRSQPPSEPEPA